MFSQNSSKLLFILLLVGFVSGCTPLCATVAAIPVSLEIFYFALEGIGLGVFVKGLFIKS